VPVPGQQAGGRDSVDFLLALGYPDAVTQAQRAATAAADRAARLGRAAAMRARGDLSGATAVLASLQADWPDDVAVLVQLAACHAEAGAFDQLRPLADALDRVAPDLPVSAVAQAVALWIEGRDREADVLLAKAATQADANLRVLMGLLALRRGRPEEARRHFVDALQAAPRLHAAANGLAQAALRMGDAAAAEAALRRSIAIAFHQPEVHRALGALLLASGRVADAPRALWAAQTLRGVRKPQVNRIGSAEQAVAAGESGN
jgi:Flp pilus assembly protein TadD